MRFLLTTLAVFALHAHADEPSAPQYTEVIQKMSNPLIEALVNEADQVTASPELGNCPHIVYRVKMKLPADVHYDVALNEFMARVTPNERTYTFGILSMKSASDNSIAKLADENASADLKGKTERLNNEANLLLNSDTVLMSGTAVYSKAGLSDAEMKIRAIVDTDANEFLLFGAGKCQ